MSLATCPKLLRRQNKPWPRAKKMDVVVAHLGLELGDELVDEPLGVLLVLGVGEVQVCGEVLVEPGGEVVSGLQGEVVTCAEIK